MPAAVVDTSPPKEDTPPSLLIQPMVLMILMIITKKKIGRDSGALKKLRTFVAALVHAHLQID